MSSNKSYDRHVLNVIYLFIFLLAYWTIAGNQYGRINEFISYISCPYNAQNISSCTPRYTSNCYPNSLVGVMCQGEATLMLTIYSMIC